jgi:hypothetical protein
MQCKDISTVNKRGSRVAYLTTFDQAIKKRFFNLKIELKYLK